MLTLQEKDGGFTLWQSEINDVCSQRGASAVLLPAVLNINNSQTAFLGRKWWKCQEASDNDTGLYTCTYNFTNASTGFYNNISLYCWALSSCSGPVGSHNPVMNPDGGGGGGIIICVSFCTRDALFPIRNLQSAYASYTQRALQALNGCVMMQSWQPKKATFALFFTVETGTCLYI